MIRKLQKTDIDTVARIWLDGNRQAHGFIPAGYWEDNLIHVKEMLLQTEVYVYEEESSRAILGFAGLEKEYIAGIFVQSDARSRGIGRMLLNYVKDRKKKLTLNVYGKNERAVRFYEREGFHIIERTKDENTGEEEYLMSWENTDMVPGKETVSGRKEYGSDE